MNPEPENAVGSIFSYPPKCFECGEELDTENQEHNLRYNTENENWEIVCDRHAGDYIANVKYGKVTVSKGIEEECVKIVKVKEE